MKTPIQEFIDEVSKCRNEMLEFNSKMGGKREAFFEGMIMAFGDVESILRFRYLEKEKDVIIDAFRYGNNNDIFGKKHPEEYYNETFNTKEK